MGSIVRGLESIYNFLRDTLNAVFAVLFEVMVYVAALVILAMLIDVAITKMDRFRQADRASRPTDGTLLLLQLSAIAALLGSIVLFSRDTASWWQPWAALAGGVAIFVVVRTFRRSDSGAEVEKLIWLTFALTGVASAALAWVARNDSLIPYTILCGVALAFGRSWFTLARPEVHFDVEESAKVIAETKVAAESSITRPLVISNVGMIYELPNGGSVEALKDVSFDLEPGRLLTLLGPSGCGKTTLLNIIAGILAPTSGVARLGDSHITAPGQDRGMVFQKGALFEWLSVNDNVGFGARMNGRSRPGSREQVQDLLRTVGLQGFGEKAVYELSGGMQQRVALARCLANDPDLILMDEPLGALDALTREKMQRLVLDLWHETGKTIVLVTHSVEEALYLGDKLFVMAPRPGRIERAYDLPFARQALTVDARELKASEEFISKREEVLGMIWEMEEQIMGGNQ